MMGKVEQRLVEAELLVGNVRSSTGCMGLGSYVTGYCG
jgi:hypothetical protein